MYTREDFEKVGIDTSKIRNGKGVCPRCGQDRKNKRDPSLYVNYQDGVYKCFNTPCDFKGSVAYKSINKDFVRKDYKKPVARLQKVSDAVVKWFEGRKISNNTLLRFKITESVEKYGEETKKAICFNYFKDEKLVNIKFRTKEKQFKLVGGAELCLYNIDALEGETEAIIVEGEIDAMSIYEAKMYNVVSVPNGAAGDTAKLEYIDNSYEKLEKIEKFIICVDDDEAGNKLKDVLSYRLGVDKCWFVKYPPELVVPDDKAAGGFRKCKDPNEVLVYLGEDRLMQMIHGAEQLPIVGAFQILDVADEVLEVYQSGRTQGDTTHIPELDAIFKWKKKEINLWSGYGNHGKALSIETDIPTSKGWVKMGDIKVGDVVYDENGQPCNVTNATDIMYNRKCYNVVFNDGSEVIADAEHLWFTHTINSRLSAKNKKKNGSILKPNGSNQEHKRILPQVRTTEDIKKSLLFKTNHDRKPRPNHSIDICKPVNFSEKRLIVQPYTLGAWLGDGHTNASSITCDNKDVQIIERIRKDGYWVKKRKSKDDNLYTIYSLSSHLRVIGVFGNKRIPVIYLRSSIEQRIELLKGLMDTDGTIGENGICEFSIVKKDLAEDVYELITSLGIKTSINVGDAKIYGRYISKRYRIAFKPNFNVFNLKRKAARHKDKRKNDWRYIVDIQEIKSVPVKCITVDSPNSLYLCTKSYIPTHNTIMFLNLAMIKSMYDGWKWAIFSPENYPASDFFIDLIEMYTGKHVDDRLGNKMTEQEFAEAMEFIQDHIIYVYPPDVQNIEELHSIFKRLHLKHGLNGVCIDPFNQLDGLFEGGSRDDQILSVLLKDVKRFALINNISYNIIAHPRNVLPDKDGKRPDVEVWHLAGGAMWNNKIDNIIMTDRPEWHLDKASKWTRIRTHKIKRRRTGGKVGGEVDFDYIVLNSRFTIRGVDKFILDPKRAAEKRADEDFYMENLHRAQLAVEGRVSFDSQPLKQIEGAIEQGWRGVGIDSVEIQNPARDFEGF